MGEMIEFFRSDSPELLNELRQSVEAGDTSRVERVAHSLKGLAATFDAEEAVAATRALEIAAREERTAAFAALERHARAKIEELSAFLESSSMSSPG
jgi:HPt (histidine-containing phosphotransfer) domain-containing protein